MPQETIEQRVCDTLWELCTVGATEILPRMSLRVDLEFDDLDLTEAVMGLEYEFSISIDDEEWERVQTVADAIELVKGKVEA